MIIRVQKDKHNPYVILNKQFLQDVKLSWKAKGILAYLLSLPDDWKIYEEELANHSNDGIKALKSGIKELLEAGYIQREKIRNAHGQYSGWEYCVEEGAPRVPFSDVGFSDVRKSPPTNNDRTNNNQTNENNHNGAFSKEKDTIAKKEQFIVDAIAYYRKDLYPRRTKNDHPVLSQQQYERVYLELSAFSEEHCLDYDDLVKLMYDFINNFKLKTDWNINHFATAGILLNCLYNCGLAS